MKRIVHVLFFILIIFIGLFFSQPASAQSVFSYSGTLRNGAGLPIPGAELLMFCGSSQSSAFTGNDGSFILYVPGGMCSLDVNVSSVDPSLAPSIEPSATNISVTGDMVQDLTIPTQTLTVTVIDSLGQPVPNASVGVSNNVLSQPFSLFSGASSNTVIEHTDGRTDTNGVIHLALVPISSITLNAFPPSGSKLTSVSETISFLSTTSVSVTLPPIFSYSGILRNGSGAPISGAELLMFCGSSQSTAFTGSDGSYVLYIPGGTCSLDVNAGGGTDPSVVPTIEPSATNIIVTGDMTQDLTIPTQILNVTVFDPLGQPLPNTQVGVSNDVLSLPFSLFPGASSNTVNENTSGKTDTNGIVHLALVPISSITLNAFPPSGSKLSRKTLQTSFLGTKNIVIEYNVISVGAITVSTNPTQINTPITTSSSFVDTSTLNTHTASWDWGDGNTTIGTVTENSGSGSISDTHTFTTPGVYTIKLNVTDNYGSVGTNTFQYVSVYNPTPQGLFSGARIFTSPIGAYPQNTSLTGKVMFGVSVKYSGTTPTGNVSMNFKTANLTFDATSISTLVTASGAATVRGSGTLNSSGGYTFLATGLDSNSGGPTIRFQIKDSSNAVVYDSQPGAADDATPTTAVTGHVVVH